MSRRRLPARWRCRSGLVAFGSRGREGRRPERELDTEGGAAALGARDLDAAAVGLDDRLDDREPEARARNRTFCGLRRAVEAVEQVLLVLDRDSGAGIVDGQDRGGVSTGQLDRDRAALGGEL